MPSLASQIEAILYLKAQPLSLAKIAEYANCDRQDAEEGLLELMSDYAHRDSALEIVESDKGYCLQLKEAFQDLVHTLVPVDVGLGALRTLAAIALKGPISQTELVELRGSGVYQHVPDLVSLGLVRKRRQSDGRSYWLQVTDKFYQYFQIDQLPAIQAPRSSESETGDESGSGNPADEWSEQEESESFPPSSEP
jgi:segregation and condensation protein B